MTDDNELETSYVATTPSAWGRGFSEDSAIEALLLNHDGDRDKELIFTHEIRGRLYEHGPGYVDADEVVDEAEYLVDGDVLSRIRENVRENELLIERMMVEAEEITGLTAEEIDALR